MKIDNRRGGRSRNRRDEILDAALEVFAERGFRAASLAAVAERVGITQQGVLHYFPGKEALLVEVLRLRDERDEASFSTSEELVDFNATRPGLVQSFTVLSAESVTDEHPAKPFFIDRYRRLRALGAQSLTDDGLATLPSGVTAEQAAALMAAVMDGLQLQWLLDPDEVDMPALYRAFVAALMRP